VVDVALLPRNAAALKKCRRRAGIELHGGVEIRPGLIEHSALSLVEAAPQMGFGAILRVAIALFDHSRAGGDHLGIVRRLAILPFAGRDRNDKACQRCRAS